MLRCPTNIHADEGEPFTVGGHFGDFSALHIGNPETGWATVYFRGADMDLPAVIARAVAEHREHVAARVKARVAEEAA